MKVRRFTALEDDWIKLQAEGRMTFAQLLHATRSTKEALVRRAAELGVVPQLRQYHRTHDGGRPECQNRRALSRQEVVASNYYADDRPAQIKHDRLLERLQKLHGDRSFGR